VTRARSSWGTSGRFAAVAILAAVPRTAAAGEARLGQLAVSIDAVVQRHLGDLDRCYRRERPRLGVPAGRIDVRWTVRGTGEIVSPHATIDTIGAPELRQCVELAIERWAFPHFGPGYVDVHFSFALGPGGVSINRVGALDANPGIDAGAAPMRALLLRHGPRFVSFACVAGKRSFLGSACNTPIGRLPRLGIDPRYTTDTPVVDVAQALVYFDYQRVEAVGFEKAGWPAPSPKRSEGTLPDAGWQDGLAVWPPGAFNVELTAYGRARVDEAVTQRCESEPASPCRDEDRRDRRNLPMTYDQIQASPLADGELLREAERQLAPTLRRFQPTRQVHLLQTISVDLDGDGVPETLHNLAVTNIEVKPRRVHGHDADPDVASTFFFIFAEKNGRYTRLPVRSKPSLKEDMDGVVIGWLDIDGDGQLELLLESEGYELLAHQLVRFRDGAFHPVAEFGYDYMGDTRDAGSRLP
jgi:hypothetical protein